LSEFSRLPPKERAARYRQLAEEAEKSARFAPSPVRESYLEIAARWRSFARNIENGGDRTDVKTDTEQTASALRSSSR
jgi:hypothetical protein